VPAWLARQPRSLGFATVERATHRHDAGKRGDRLCARDRLGRDGSDPRRSSVASAHGGMPSFALPREFGSCTARTSGSSR
jgi:hypothetical protein